MGDLWKYLAHCGKPIILYGTGNGADKIIDELDRLCISVNGIFASDGFVRNRMFRNIKVESYENIIKKFGEDIIILIAFGSSLPGVLERFAVLASKHEVYVPDVPVCGGEIFNTEYYYDNIGKIEKARSCLADAESKMVFDEIIDYRLSGKIELLFDRVTDTETVMKTILSPENYRLSVDAGAYTGDTAEELLAFSPNLDTVIAIEPDEKNLSKLCARSLTISQIEPEYAAAWDCFDVLQFTKGGGRGIKKSVGKTVEVIAKPIDSIVGNRVTDYMKYDVEGSEIKALVGSERTITAFRPELQVALYHRTADLFEIPLYIHEKYPFYKLFIRRYLSVPCWDINLFCVGGSRI